MQVFQVFQGVLSISVAMITIPFTAGKLHLHVHLQLHYYTLQVQLRLLIILWNLLQHESVSIFEVLE